MSNSKFSGLDEVILKDYPNTAGLIVRRGDETLYENYFNGSDADNAIHVASVTKSVFSALLGIAIEEGHIGGIDRRVTDFFPDGTRARVQGASAPIEKTAQNITLRNLITMTAPYKFEAEPFEEFFSSENWLDFALNCLSDDSPAEAFRYSPIVGTHILSGILANSVGKPILDYANEKLFAPLGISMKNKTFQSAEEQMAWYSSVKNSRGWVADPQGLNAAGWGLMLTPADMVKIGRLYLDGGMWENKRLVPEKWIEESTAGQARYEDLSYGYLWWVIDPKERIYAALGDGGNVIYVNPNKCLTVAMASYFMPDAKDRIDFINEFIEPNV